MGVGSSRVSNSLSNNVFAGEQQELCKIVHSLMSEDNRFRNREYNMFLKGRCEEVTLLAERKLKRHTKLQLGELGDALYVIPIHKIDASKRVLCSLISEHYVRILRILYVLKHVHDLEHGGDYGVAGIIMRNITTKDGLVQIKYCNGPQEQPGLFNKGVDFSKLSGFEVFVNEMLSESERANFMQHIRELLGKGSKSHLRRWICKDKLLGKNDYSRIYQQKWSCGGGGDGLMVRVQAHNPILAWNLCTFPKELTSKMTPSIDRAIRKMKALYRENIRNIEQLLNEIAILNVNGEYTLRHVTSPKLDDFELRTKKLIITLYIQSFVAFRAVYHEIEKSSINRNE